MTDDWRLIHGIDYTRRCIDCTYCSSESERLQPYHLRYWCFAPGRPWSRVTGSPIALNCHDARQDPTDVCGPDGRLFEKAPRA